MPLPVPAGYYEDPRVNNPRVPLPRPTNRDSMGLIDDGAMEPDEGIGNAPPRDPYMANLPPVQAPGMAKPAVTRLTPGRQTPFSRADAQALAALDPRALDEANAIAARPESIPAKITGSFGGQNFEMQPTARVDRNVLARLYSQAAERKAQERQDAVRAQEQGGKERLVSIPGQQMTERTKITTDADLKKAEAERQAMAPERLAKVGALQAETAAKQAAAGREAQTFGERVTPEQAAIDAAYERAAASPFANTEAGTTAIKDLSQRTTAGKNLTEQQRAAVNESNSPTKDVGTVASEMMNDPLILKLFERRKATKPGIFTGVQGRTNNRAVEALLNKSIESFARKNGVDPMELRQYTSLME